MSNGASRIVSRLARTGRQARLVVPGSRRCVSSSQRQWSTPLAKTIADAINTTGPVSIAAYMRQCLTSPDGGYYTSGGAEQSDIFGRKGDFITSPEISQIFGELLAVWTVTEWIAQGKQSNGVQLVEVGPGKGTLMADMLRALRNFKNFASSVEVVYLVEASDRLRQAQKQVLCGDAAMEETDIGYRSTSEHLGVPIVWVNHIRSLPNNEQGQNKVPFIIAHEFFDALPIHAFQAVASPHPENVMTPTGPTTPRQPLSSTGTQWRELVVSTNPGSEAEHDKGLEFRLSLAKSSTPASMLMPEMSERYKALKSTRGSTIEISADSHQYIQEFAQRIGGSFTVTPDGKSVSPAEKPKEPAGAALILDYGPMETIPVNSLRGIQNHQLVSPFTSPGQVDLSADVDFTALAEAAIRASPGVEVYGPMEQGMFLKSLGINERATQLLRRAVDNEKRDSIESGWKRLVERGGGGMGKIYKAMAIVPESNGQRRPVGFGGEVKL